MKFLVEFNPPAEVKNDFEKNSRMQKKVGEYFTKLKPEAAWFTLRYGLIVIDVNTPEELADKIGPLFHLFKTDAKISPAFSLQEFPKVVSLIGDAAKQYQ